MRGTTRAVALVRRGDRLVSDGVELCGFVPVRGAGENRIGLVLLHDIAGEEVGLRLDGHTEPDTDALRTALHGPRTDAWSGVMLAGEESDEHLDLWLTTALDDLPLPAATPAAHARGLVTSASPLGVPTLVDGDSTHRDDRARIEIHPAGTPDTRLPAGRIVDQPYTRVLLTWP